MAGVGLVGLVSEERAKRGPHYISIGASPRRLCERASEPDPAGAVDGTVAGPHRRPSSAAKNFFENARET